MGTAAFSVCAMIDILCMIRKVNHHLCALVNHEHSLSYISLILIKFLVTICVYFTLTLKEKWWHVQRMKCVCM